MSPHAAYIAVPKQGKRLGEGFSKAAKLQALEWPGRQTQPARGYQTPVSYLSDLLALRRVIILCQVCAPRFAKECQHQHYRKVFIPDFTGRTDGYTVNGRCDSCTQETAIVGGGRAYQPEEEYLKTHIDPSQARRAARATAKALGTWQFVQREQARRAHA